MAINKNKPLYFFTSLSFFIPLALLMNSGFEEGVRVYMSNYILMAPFCYFNIYLALVSLETSKLLRLIIFSFLVIFNFLSYFDGFYADEILKVAQKKEEHLVKLPGVANLIFALKHPFIEEVSRFYSKNHLGYDSYIIPAPMQKNDVAIIAHVVNNYNGINFIVTDESHELDSEPVPVDIITNNFYAKDVSYHKFDSSPHPYLPNREKKLKVIFFVKGSRR